MKKLSLLISSLVFLFLLFFSSKTALAKTVDCYVGDQKIGKLTVEGFTEGRHNYLTRDFLVVNSDNSWASIDFYVGDSSKFSEVYYKMGNSNWTRTLTTPYSYVSPPYEAVIDNSPCGNVWMNIRYRSVLDGQLHYCNALMPKYTQGLEVNPLLKPDCIFSNCTANGGTNVRAISMDQQIAYPGSQCSNDSYRYYLNDQLVSAPPYIVAGRCRLNYRVTSLTTQDTQTLRVSPELPSGYSIYKSYLTYYNFINNSYCGSSFIEVTPTPTPTPSSCPLTQQQTGFSGSGTPLINDYNTTQYKGSPQYTTFIANKNGKVSKVEIYGTLDRNIPKGGKVLQCKITDSTGTTTLGESATNNGAFTKGVSWMGVQFTTPVNIVNGIPYRLYCKVNNVYGGGSIYWLDFWNNRIDKTRKIYLCE